MHEPCSKNMSSKSHSKHTSSSCLTPAFNDRHDRVVYFVLRNILLSTEHTEHILSQLRFGKVTMLCDYVWGQRGVKMKARIKVITDPELYHNRQDIIVCLTNPSEVYVCDIAISQNIEVQENIKKIRYGKNLTEHITHKNFNNLPRSFNICETLGKMHKFSSVKLGVLIIGTLGEILFTDTLRQCFKYFGEL